MKVFKTSIGLSLKSQFKKFCAKFYLESIYQYKQEKLYNFFFVNLFHVFAIFKTLKLAVYIMCVFVRQVSFPFKKKNEKKIKMHVTSFFCNPQKQPFK